MSDRTEGALLLRPPRRATPESAVGAPAAPARSRSGQEAADAKNPKPVGGYAAPEEMTRRSDLRELRGKKPKKTEDGRFVIREVVLGADDRERVGNTAAWPFSAHGHVIMEFPDGNTFIGSGTLVGPHHVLTAGHCVFSSDNGGFASDVVFNAGQNEDTLPFGSVRAVRVLTVPQFSNGEDPDFDMGMLILESDVGNEAGFYAIKAFDSAADLLALRVNVSGYPGDKGGEQMWTMADVIKSVTAEQFTYLIDTAGGQSGSGVWTPLADLGETVVGIHTTGSLSGNGATRITRAKLDTILGWIAEF